MTYEHAIDRDLTRFGLDWDKDGGPCLMQWVSVFAGVPFSDFPECTDRYISRIGQFVNDEIIDDAKRQELKSLGRSLSKCSPLDPLREFDRRCEEAGDFMLDLGMNYLAAIFDHAKPEHYTAESFAWTVCHRIADEAIKVEKDIDPDRLIGFLRKVIASHLRRVGFENSDPEA